jgi:hypothetical protein
VSCERCQGGSARGAAGDQPRVKSNGCRESKARKSGSHLTPRWRDQDSNPRSPAFDTALLASAALPVSPQRPTRFCVTGGSNPPPSSSESGANLDILWTEPSSTGGPKHVVKTGRTPVLEGEEWRKLLGSIPATTLRDPRDRALIATLTYSDRPKPNRLPVTEIRSPLDEKPTEDAEPYERPG